MINLRELEIFPKEIYAIEQFLSYEYYYETVKLWEELIQYAEDLLDKYSAHLAPDHRAQDLSDQADYVWGTIVLPNFKATLHHLVDGLDDLKEGYLPILGRMSSIRNDIIAQSRDYPYDWMNSVKKGSTEKYIQLENKFLMRANNIYISIDYSMQWGYKDLLNDQELLIGVKCFNNATKYKLNTDIMAKTGEEILKTGIYRSVEPYSACKFFIKEMKIDDENVVKWRLFSEVKCYSTDPESVNDLAKEKPKRIPTTWMLVERVSDENESDNNSNHIKLTKKGGEKAGHTGYWMTPAQPNTRSYFNKDEILPKLSQADWGDVYWYFDGDE